ncbi:MAG: 6,7-dimethyl-8-ribityllumazine synthase [Chitinophagales bacterium]|nr:6,7-dimethyl-8-ribityllumazine synthase [Chitinophagales bacterium]
MATYLKNLSDFNPATIADAKGMSFGIVVSDYNDHITHALLDGCIRTLLKAGAKEKDIRVVHVPGAFELTSGAQMIATAQKPDAVICLGCVIKGETKHDEYINHAVANGITQLSLLIEKPVIFGLLTPNNLQQAKARAGGKHGNKGVEAAVTAIRMVTIKRKLKLR